MNDRIIFNPGSERNILSICLKNQEKLIELDNNGVFAEHFSVEGHKYIYIAMMYLYSKNIKPTPLSIVEVLNSDKSKKAVSELGGLEYLMLMENSYIPEDNFKIFLEKIQQSYTRSYLIDFSSNLKDFLLSEDAEILNPTEIIQYAEKGILELSSKSTNSKDVYKMGDETEEVLNERSKNPDQVPGLETGWVELDRHTNGGQPGDLIVLVAPSKTGKSVTLTNWATNMSIKDDVPILYIDTEMNSREQEDRILANLTGIPHSEILNGMYVMDTVNGKADDKIERLKKAREELKLGQYYHVYMPHFDIDSVSALAKKFAMKFGIKALFFDYIKIPSSSKDMKSMQEYQALGFFTSGLKELAGILNIPIYSACQTNRNDLESTSPDASNIGGSYRILQLASKLMFLINKSNEQIARDGFQNGNQQLIIKYQRNGESDCPPINIFFDKPILRQVEC